MFSDHHHFRLPPVTITFIYWLFILFSTTKSSSLCLKNSEMGKCLNSTTSANSTEAVKMSLPISTTFTLPSPLPTWPKGEGNFASGTIDLGGLQVLQLSTFSKIWATHVGGPENLGATFYEPSSIPQGFFMLGSYSQPNNKPLFGWVLVAKDTTNNPLNGSLTKPIDYTLVWSSESSNVNQDGVGYIWLPVAPTGYKVTGYIVTNSSEKPYVDNIRCVRSDLTELVENDGWIWGLGDARNSNGVNMYSSRPIIKGTMALGVSVNTFIVQNGGDNNIPLVCLKNVDFELSSMPNVQQIDTIMQTYSPLIYFHPDEKYLTSSVNWFFENGALLYQAGQQSKPNSINLDGSNLPQGGSDDSTYWLDLPVDNNAKEMVKKGNLDKTTVYLHVKPMFGATFSDIAIWVFYPFNGPSRAKVEFVTIALGRIGEHVGDWEHLTLRVSNFNGELKSVFFSEHSGGIWVDASELEFKDGNKPVTYACLNAHAFYSKAGLVLRGSDGIGIRDDSAKSNMMIDTGSKFSVVAAEYLLPPSTVVEPPWLNYARKWGPNISYNIDDELNKIEKLLPGKLKTKFKNFVKSIPREVLGENGPTGPKMKNNWNGDEST